MPIETDLMIEYQADDFYKPECIAADIVFYD